MDLRKIKKLIDLLEESNLAELEIKEGEEIVRLSRMPKGMAMAPLALATAAVTDVAVGGSKGTASKGGAEFASTAGISAGDENLPEGHVVRSNSLEGMP